MFAWLCNWLHKRKLRRLLRWLGSDLVKRYGRRSWFTPGQVRTAIFQGGVPEDNRAVAYAVFLCRQDYNSASDEDGIDLARRSLRAQTAQLLFGDDGLKNLLAYDAVESAHDESPARAQSVPKNWFVDRPTVPVLDDVRYDGGYQADLSGAADAGGGSGGGSGDGGGGGGW
jgi:hypothetical protein